MPFIKIGRSAVDSAHARPAGPPGQLEFLADEAGDRSPTCKRARFRSLSDPISAPIPHEKSPRPTAVKKAGAQSSRTNLAPTLGTFGTSIIPVPGRKGFQLSA